jgi:hypothetical protein
MFFGYTVHTIETLISISNFNTEFLWIFKTKILEFPQTFEKKRNNLLASLKSLERKGFAQVHYEGCA